MICSNYVYPLLLFTLMIFINIFSTANAVPISKQEKVTDVRGNKCIYASPAQVPVVELNDTVVFHANETCTMFRTDTVQLKWGNVLDYNYMVEGKRTRLRLYICLMESGGECVLYKHRSDGGGKIEGCGVMEPWAWKSSEYSFYVALERRPRRFSDKEKEARWRRRRHGRAAHRTVVEVNLGTIKSKKDACPNGI